METIKKLGKWLALKDNEGYLVSVAFALLIVSVLIAGYQLTWRPTSDKFTSIYLLDSERQAADYPELLVINQNASLTLWAGIENHMGKTQYYQIQLKVTNRTIVSLPLNAEATSIFLKTLENGENWETPVTLAAGTGSIANVSLNEAGDYSVAFELWVSEGETENLEFSGNFCVLNVQVKEQV